MIDDLGLWITALLRRGAWDDVYRLQEMNNMVQPSKPRLIEVEDALSEFLANETNRETTYPMNGIPPVTDRPLTEAEQEFLAKSTFESLKG